MLKKGDTIILICIFLSIVLSLCFIFFPKSDGKTVTVKKDNQTVYEVPLNKNTVLKLDGNTVEIKNGTVTMQWADCKNQLCVHQGKISKSGESIICLPHRVSVTVS